MSDDEEPTTVIVTASDWRVLLPLVWFILGMAALSFLAGVLRWGF